MNKIDRSPSLVGYEDDFALWCAQQGALLRGGRLTALDRKNLAEEIETLGRSEESEIENRLAVLITHLLKWAYQPDKRKPGWKSTIREQRGRLAKRLRKNPSLKRYPADVLDEEYSFAIGHAAEETGLPEDSFPPSCPFTIDQILDPNWLPDSA